MAKLFGNLHLILVIGLVAAIAVMVAFAPSAPVDANAILYWLHTFFGVLWIGLLYYLNFVQVPTMLRSAIGESHHRDRRARRGAAGRI